MKSALTAALSGAPAASAPPKPPSSKFTLDTKVFPCLLSAPDDGTPVLDVLVEEIDSIDLKSVPVVGSAPTNTLMPNGTALADYPLDPYRRRSGKEALGTSAGLSVDSKPSSLTSPHGTFSSGSLAKNYAAVIGSLPKGLTESERFRIRAATPMSPARGLLQEMPMNEVSSRTSEGRRLRRSVLKGAVVAFVTAGYSGKRFIFEKAKELGVKAIVLDASDSWAQLMEQEGVIAKFVPIDFSDAEHVLDACLEGINKAVATIGGGLDGVTTFCEMAVPLVARLAEKLGVPGNAPEAVDAARDKYLTRAAMTAAGLPTPRNARVNSPEDVEPAGKHVGFPAVIKPVAGAASIGVVRVNSMEELHAAYRKVARDMSRAKVVAGALVEGKDEGEDGGNAGTWINVQLMLEEYLDGPEVDCDLVISDGVCVYGAVTDNWPTIEPYFNETGSNCPSLLPRGQQAELLELSVKSVAALGFTLGVYHVEAKYTSRGPRLIEVNARMGGGPVRDTNLLVWGVDMVEEHLMTSVGIPARPPTSRKPLLNLAEYSINAKSTGIIRDFKTLDKWATHPDVLYARPLVPAGSKVVAVTDGLPTWVCELMVVKPTVQEAVDFITEIEASLDLPIDPLPAKAT